MLITGLAMYGSFSSFYFLVWPDARSPFFWLCVHKLLKLAWVNSCSSISFCQACAGARTCLQLAVSPASGSLSAPLSGSSTSLSDKLVCLSCLFHVCVSWRSCSYDTILELTSGLTGLTVLLVKKPACYTAPRPSHIPPGLLACPNDTLPRGCSGHSHSVVRTFGVERHLVAA